MTIPPHGTAEIQRVLRRAAQRLLDEELTNAHRVVDPNTTAIHPAVNHDIHCADCEQPVSIGDEYVLTFKPELRPYRQGGAKYCMTCANEQGLLAGVP